jgi:hypothetical protein
MVASLLNLLNRMPQSLLAGQLKENPTYWVRCLYSLFVHDLIIASTILALLLSSKRKVGTAGYAQNRLVLFNFQAFFKIQDGTPQKRKKETSPRLIQAITQR